MPWSDIGQVDRQDVGDQDFRGMTAAGTIWFVFVGEVLAKREREVSVVAIGVKCGGADHLTGASGRPQ